MNATKTMEQVRVTVGDAGIIDHAGAAMLGRLADQVGVGAALSERIAWQASEPRPMVGVGCCARRR